MILNSLKVKIVGLVALIVICTISVASWYQYSQQKRMIEELAAQSSKVLVESIVNNIQTSMKTGHSGDISYILARLKSNDYIKELRIVSRGHGLRARVRAHRLPRRDELRPLERDAAAGLYPTKNVMHCQNALKTGFIFLRRKTFLTLTREFPTVLNAKGVTTPHKKRSPIWKQKFHCRHL